MVRKAQPVHDQPVYGHHISQYVDHYIPDFSFLLHLELIPLGDTLFKLLMEVERGRETIVLSTFRPHIFFYKMQSEHL